MIQNEIWKSLTDPQRAQLLSAARTLDLKRGDFVYRQGDQPKGLYFVEKGLVGLMLLGPNSGKEHLVRFFREGHFFGHRALFSQEGYHGNALALDTTRLKMLPSQSIRDLLEQNPKIYRNFVEVLCRELRRAEIQHVLILENEVKARTALALVYLKELHPDHQWTRQEIANFTASTAPTVIKTLAELENLGLIRQDGRSIEILNRDGLIALQDTETN